MTDPRNQPPREDRPKTEQPTSLTLLQRARSHDNDAWRRLVTLYTPFVAYWCNRWRVRPQDTEDVMQEVFHAASDSLEQFRRDRPGDSFRGWLRGITRNVVLMHFRRNERETEASGGTDAMLRLQQIEEGTLSEEEDPAVEVSDLYQRALDLVRIEFEERTWQMFWQTVIDSRSPQDVAADMNVTPAAIRKAKSRVLHRLKEEVGDLID